MHTSTYREKGTRVLLAVLIMLGAYSVLPVEHVEAVYKWNPGHYVVLYDWSSRHDTQAERFAFYDSLANEPAIKGVVLMQRGWRSLEGAKDDYSQGFSWMQRELDYLWSHGQKRLIWWPFFGYWGGPNSSYVRELVPDYMQTPEYNNGAIANATGVIIQQWHPRVIERQIALLRAYGTRFNSHPAIEAVRPFAESAQPWDSAHPAPPEWYLNGVPEIPFRNAQRDILIAIKPYWQNTVLYTALSWIREIGDIFPSLATHGFGAGGTDQYPWPNGYPGNSGAGQKTDSDDVYFGRGDDWGNQAGTSYVGVIPYWNDNQDPVYWGKEGYWLPSEIFAEAVKKKQGHVTWTSMWLMGANDEYSRGFDRTDMTWEQYRRAVAWETGILPFIRSNPVPNNPPPSSLGQTTTGGTTPPPTTPSTCTNQQTSTASIPTGYGASYNPLTSAREYLVQASCTNTTSATITAGNGNPLTYVYNRGYYYSGTAWTPYTLTCASGALISGAWCPGRATASIPLPQNPTNVIAYTCQYTNNTWKCGCRDATCSTAYWQLQRVGR